MVKVKSNSEIKQAYEESTATVPRRFKAGVSTAEYQAPALAGQDLYVEQMQRPEILARRAKGIQNISDTEWRKATIDKGATIIGARMKAASQKQVDGFAPYRTALEGVTLPPRTADPMANLMNRAGAIVQALVDKKKELEG